MDLLGLRSREIANYSGHDLAAQPQRFADRIRIDSAILEIGLGTSHEEGTELSQDVKPREINILAIHDVVRAQFEDQLIQKIYVVNFSVSYADKYR